MKKIVVCPNCESEDLEYFEERYYTKYFELDEYNEPTSKMKYRTISEPNGCRNWQCNKCGCLFGGSSEQKALLKEVEDND